MSSVQEKCKFPLQLLEWSQQRGVVLRESLDGIRKRRDLVKELNNFLENVEDDLQIKEDCDLPTDMDSLQALLQEHEQLEGDITARQPDHDFLLRHSRRKPTSHLPPPRNRLRLRSNAREAAQPPKPPEAEYTDPSVNRLHNRWKLVWLKSLDRRKRLQDAIDFVNEVGSLLLGKYWMIDFLKAFDSVNQASEGLINFVIY